jgi:hypothetical protein
MNKSPVHLRVVGCRVQEKQSGKFLTRTLVHHEICGWISDSDDLLAPVWSALGSRVTGNPNAAVVATGGRSPKPIYT